MTGALDDLLTRAKRLRDGGDSAGALGALGGAAERARADRDPRLAYILRHLSDVERQTGMARRAHAAADEAVLLLRAQSSSLDLANALRLRALAADAAGLEAAPDWAEARDLYAGLDIPAGVAECELHLRS
ncbi:MAG: hypothetical protein KJ676_04900 [Alphaproteobacteria bacterium]|nr:hypothetical protein [Alphaproteobacteria bacterium]MBU1527267.1 hypothetical protein [Alphaproteobacteria bacterium]MBU2116566.1 hypothetical protein [Alphaproteobacteria bacterium]MBU2350354.1 hypothetical protein [Alphaproteobacteria bacterium]MBU2383506.1 hypothetical protein [Alphaproteobacteria bacterium]